MSDRLRVVLDCDTGVDDAMCILYGLLSPNIDVVGIGTVWGNVPVELATVNTLRLLEIVGQPGVPVARGAGKPMIGQVSRYATYVHGEDGQGNTNLPPPSLQPVHGTAAEQIVRLAHEYPGELTLVPVGPMTNVGIALTLDPGIAQLYKGVVLMGGSPLTPGYFRRVSDPNIWNDPEAAQLIFEAGWPITTVGINVTERVRFTGPMREQLQASGTPAGLHLAKIVDFYMRNYEQRWGVYESAMHDALALAIAEDPTIATEAPLVRVDVELHGALTRGYMAADLRPRPTPADANARVVLEVDTPRFLQRFMQVLTDRG